LLYTKEQVYNANIVLQLGFVLPYVLAVLAILSLVGLMAVDRIQNASDFVLDIQELQKAELALAEAEHQVVYSFVSNSYLPKGLNLNTTRPIDP